MGIANSILGVDIEDVSLDTLNTFFIEGKEESNIFELKSFFENNQTNYTNKENAVLKTICGFLNSSGGLVIWGAPIGGIPAGGTEKIFTGDLSPVDKDLGKDAFISKIANRITPTPVGIKFKKILVADNRFVYLIEVPESSTKPHQFDERYFMRLDGQTKVAPHHYIEALFKQIRYPELGGYIKFGRLTWDGNSYLLDIKIFVFNHSPLQNEQLVWFNLLINKGAFNNWALPIGNNKIKYKQHGHQAHFSNFAEILHYGNPTYHSAKIVLNHKDLIANNYEIEFILTFGGKYSPMKSSRYKMRLNGNLYENTTPLVFFTEENKLMYELGKDKGEEMEKVDRILGR